MMFKIADIFHTSWFILRDSIVQGWFWSDPKFAFTFMYYAWVFEGIQDLGFIWRLESDIINKAYAMGDLKLTIADARRAFP